MKLQRFFLVTMITCSTITVKAQQDSAKQHQKIEQLFSILNMEAAHLQAANTTADQTIANYPTLANRREEARAFFIKHMSYHVIKNDLVKLYAKYYTTEEIDDLIKFYKTSAGKKQQTAAIQLQAEAMNLLTQNLKVHEDEFNKLLTPPANNKSDKTTAQ